MFIFDAAVARLRDCVVNVEVAVQLLGACVVVVLEQDLMSVSVMRCSIYLLATEFYDTISPLPTVTLFLFSNCSLGQASDRRGRRHYNTKYRRQDGSQHFEKPTFHGRDLIGRVI